MWIDSLCLFRMIGFVMLITFARMVAGADPFIDGVLAKFTADERVLLKKGMEEYDFLAWKGKTKEVYEHSVPVLDLSTIHFEKAKTDIVVLPRKGSVRSELIGLTKDGGRNLTAVSTLSVQNVAMAQMYIIKNLSLSYKRPSDVVVLEGIGDRAYRGVFWGGHYIVFARNNVYVAVNSWSEEYPAEPLARQVDALILKMSRAPEKK